MPGVRVQMPEELKLPGEPEKVTVPDGVRAVPALEVSITVAVQLEAWFTTTEAAQATEVLVVLRLTVTVAAVVLELEVCDDSPA